jgi:hypothetical protein
MGEKRNADRDLVGRPGGIARKAYFGGKIILKRILEE